MYDMYININILLMRLWLFSDARAAAVHCARARCRGTCTRGFRPSFVLSSFFFVGRRQAEREEKKSASFRSSLSSQCYFSRGPCRATYCLSRWWYSVLTHDSTDGLVSIDPYVISILRNSTNFPISTRCHLFFFVYIKK